VPGWYSEMWGCWFGGRMWDGDSRITANSPENIEAFTWYQSHAEKLGVNNLRTFGQTFGNFASPQSPFMAGKVAMVLQGVWLYNFIEKFAPGMEWGVAPFPSVDPERLPNVCIVESDILVIPRGARHPREAFEFMEYVNSPAAIEKLNLGQRKFSPLREVSDEFTVRHPNPYISVFMDLAGSSNACHVPKITVWQEYKDEMGVSASRLDAELTTPREALGEVQERVQWKFDRILRRWNKVKDKRLNEWSRYDPE
ncbi:MAG: extracellular solute-binding protein, partial [Kiritimatiellae bacterium]|nr:extracellular solute-binding protein [Kiritimatiellia bacterium]